MSLGEVISDSVKYPFSDITKFLIVGIFALLAGIGSMLTAFKIEGTAVLAIGAIVGLIFSLILAGYNLKVVKNGIDHSSAVPDFDFVGDLVNGIKVLIISIVYFIIPLIIIVVFAGVSGFAGAALNNIAAASGVALIIGLIVAFIFAIFQIVALARFANTGEMGAAFSFGEVFADVKQIGIGSILGFLIVSAIVFVVALVISSLLAIIPFVGIIIASIVLGGFITLFYNRGIGLLYSKV